MAAPTPGLLSTRPHQHAPISLFARTWSLGELSPRQCSAFVRLTVTSGPIHRLAAFPIVTPAPDMWQRPIVAAGRPQSVARSLIQRVRSIPASILAHLSIRPPEL